MNVNLKEIANVQFSSGKTIKEILEYNGVNYWWYNDSIVYDDIDRSSYDNVHKLGLFIVKYIPHIIYYSDLVMSKILLTPPIEIPANNNPKKSLVLLKNSTERWTIKTSKNGEVNVASNYYDNIIKKFDDSISTLTIITDIPTPARYLKYLKITKNYAHPSVALTRYWNHDVWKKERAAMRHFKLVYRELLLEDKWWTEVEMITNLSIPKLKEIFEYYILFICQYSVRHYYLMDNLIEIEKPSLLVLVGESAYMGRGWSYQGQNHHIPCVGLQHGNITQDDPGYVMHTIMDISSTSGSRLILPDYTLTWGEKYSNYLTSDLSYPKNRVITTGNPQYDRLFNYDLQKSKESVCSKYGIPKDHKIIVWTTQSHINSEQENEQYFSEMFSAIDHMENITLIIKPHPAEGDRVSVFSERYYKHHNINLHIADKSSDTTELISACDILVIKNSTTGQEGVVFGKQIIVLDFSPECDKGHYVSEGVAYPVFGLEKLRDTIITLLTDKTKNDNNKSLFIANYLYKTDGNASKRCADIISKLVEK